MRIGLLINTETAPTARRVGSRAWDGIGNTYFWVTQSRNIAGVVLMQFLPFCDAQALRALPISRVSFMRSLSSQRAIITFAFTFLIIGASRDLGLATRLR